MHFRTIDEWPFAVPRPGVPRLLLGFAALSLLLHGLLLIDGDGAPALTIQQLGSPYIRAVLNTEATTDSSNDHPPNTDKNEERPSIAEPRAARHDTPAPNRTSSADRQTEVTRAREIIAPPATATTHRKPLQTAEDPAETSLETPPPTRESGTTDTARQTLPASESPARESSASSPQMSTAAQRNYLLGQLQDQLSRYLNYPLRARRRGWEGEVLLGLRLDSEGQLHDIHLLHSSGYALLDRSALKALARIERLQLPVNAPPLQPTHLQLPVIYRLSES